MSRTRIAAGISTAVGVAAALAVMAAPTARAQARGHDDTFAVVFVPGLAPGLHQAANPGQMGGR